MNAARPFIAPHRLAGSMRDARAISQRLTGPAVHKRIPERRFGFHPPINWREIVVLYLSAAVIGAMVVSL